MPDIPLEIIDAMAKVQGSLRTLGKEDFNPHGKYEYVSIDKYYETVAREAHREGLTWIARVVDSKIVSERAVQFTYSFDVFHKSGKVAMGYFVHPIIHPIQGAQTAGSSLSYADKLFMRHAFKVRTGETDADASDPHEDMGRVRQPRDEPKNEWRGEPKIHDHPGGETKKEKLLWEAGEVIRKTEDLDGDELPVFKEPEDDKGYDILVAAFLEFMPFCTTKRSLEDWWLTNQEALNALKDKRPEKYHRVKDAFTDRKEEIMERSRR